jgi:uracil-DNA glycosylase family 4
MNPPLENPRGPSPRDVYLAWQADIGTEDVILVEPWIRPAAPAPRAPEPFHGGFSAAPTRPFEDHAASAPAAAPAPAPLNVAAGENFFESIAAALSKPEPFTTKRAAKAAAPAAQPLPAAPASDVPEFKDLESYWAFLQDAYPKWYPGISSTLTRAQGAPRPVLAVVEFSPSLTSGPRVFAGVEGEYLDKMLKAIGLERSHLYLTSVMKTPPVGKAWSRRDAARMLPTFLKELRLAQCGLVLLLGETCAQLVMRTGQGLAALEEQAVNAEDLAFTATWHPQDLLNDQTENQSLRRSAWKHLKWVRTRLPAPGA